MAVTEAQFRERQELLRKQIGSQRTINEAYLRQAAVSAELLTGHEGWDRYLQQLQVVMAQYEAELKSWQEKIPGAVLDSDLRLAQLKIAVCLEGMAVITHCMNLPKEILAHAQEVGHDRG